MSGRGSISTNAAGAPPRDPPRRQDAAPMQPQRQPSPEPSRLASRAEPGSAQLAQAPVRRATIADDKSKGYFSDKADRSIQNLNGKVTVKTASGETSRVLCRHLAAEYVFAAKKSTVLQAFSSLPGISAHFEPFTSPMNQRLHNLCAPEAGSQHLVYAHEMGNYLVQLARELDQSSGPQQANVLLLSSTHATGIQLQKKIRKPGEEDEGASYFAMNFYDPNRSGNHLRKEFAEPEQLLTSSQKWRSPEYLCICQDVRLKAHRNEPAPPPTPTAMALMLYGHLEQDLKAATAQVDSMSPDQLQGLLGFRSKHGDIPLLRLGLNHANPASAKTTLQLFEAISRKLDLDSNAIVAMMEARVPSGGSVFASAMKHGKAHVVREFGESMARLGLDASSIAKLLSAEHGGHGVPALHLACLSGQVSTVHAFTQVIDQFKETLNETQRRSLLDSVHNGESASDVARKNGHAEVSFALAVSRNRLCPG